MTEHHPDLGSIATVTVSFNPDIRLLRTQLSALPIESFKMVVDNASEPDTLLDIQALVLQTPNAQLLRNNENLGLATAINRGVRELSNAAPAAVYVLLLDQDSEPTPGSIAALLNGFEALERAGERVGCVGPTLLDVATGLSHGFHQCSRWRWRRVYPPRKAREPVSCANLNGSGTLVPINFFKELGGLEESLFIDHVDTEWAFRVLAHHYRLFGIPQAVFRHRMGDASRRIWLFGWRVWPIRTPLRHYFLYRNAVSLIGRDYVPDVWKFWAVAKLILTALFTLVTGPRRFAQLCSMRGGTIDGLALIKGRRR